MEIRPIVVLKLISSIFFTNLTSASEVNVKNIQKIPNGSDESQNNKTLIIKSIILSGPLAALPLIGYWFGSKKGLAEGFTEGREAGIVLGKRMNYDEIEEKKFKEDGALLQKELTRRNNIDRQTHKEIDEFLENKKKEYFEQNKELLENDTQKVNKIEKHFKAYAKEAHELIKIGQKADIIFSMQNLEKTAKKLERITDSKAMENHEHVLKIIHERAE